MPTSYIQTMASTVHSNSVTPPQAQPPTFITDPSPAPLTGSRLSVVQPHLTGRTDPAPDPTELTGAQLL